MRNLYLLNPYRFKHPRAPDLGNDDFGWFAFTRPDGVVLRCLASSGDGWDHVSVSVDDRCPTWEEMCFVKAQFFKPDEVCVEYHPAEADYVNHHPYCLHIWRPLYAVMPTPPAWMVGPKAGETVADALAQAAGGAP